jgi:hypothetical protein
MTPNYNKPVAQVYIHTTRHLITKNNSLQLLVDAGVNNDDNLRLPSWVPKYNLCRLNQRISFNTSVHRMASADIRTKVVNLKLFSTVKLFPIMKLFPTIKLIRVNLNITAIILPLL